VKTLLIIVIAIAVAGAGGYFSYTTAYSTALAAGTTAGQEKGYQTGYTAGQEAGNTTGYAKGKVEGQTAGQKAGYDSGYTKGKEEGYTNGIKDGTTGKLGEGYVVLHNPTLAEAKEFLAQDPIDKVPYNELTYVCTHYARDVINNAVKKGIRTAYVEIRHPGMSHSIVAFETIDKGIVYFEPQYDSEVRPALGKKLWECMLPKADGAVFTAPNYDDTINDILIIW
jgi:hypothetical protein